MGVLLLPMLLPMLLQVLRSVCLEGPAPILDHMCGATRMPLIPTCNVLRYYTLSLCCNTVT